MAHPGFVPLEKEPEGVPALGHGAASVGALPDGGAYGLRVRSAPATLKWGNVETAIHPLWLEGGGEKPMAALLCADGAQAKIGSPQDAVLYLAQDGVWVTMLSRAPRALFTASVLAPHQEDVRYHAWTLAQAVRMWSGAHKGVLPAPDEALAALQSLMPW